MQPGLDARLRGHDTWEPVVWMTVKLSAAIRNYGERFHNDRFPNPVIPALATPGLDARLRGHDAGNA